MDVHMHRQAITIRRASSKRKHKFGLARKLRKQKLVRARTRDQAVSDCSAEPLDHVCDMLSSDPPRYMSRCYIWRFCPQIRFGCDENIEANTSFYLRTKIYAKSTLTDIIWGADSNFRFSTTLRGSNRRPYDDRIFEHWFEPTRLQAQTQDVPVCFWESISA